MRKKLPPRTLSPLLPKIFYPPRGQKQVYLPNFTLTLLRTPHAPPHFASFLTPLNLNKLDLKDYLWNAYGLQVLTVRSFVIQARVREDKPGVKLRNPNRWFRPRATKKMTVELVQNAPGQGPFIWPDPPEDLTPWDKQTWDKMTQTQETEQERRGPDRLKQPKADVESLAEQARRLRGGEEKWRPGWMDYGVGIVRGGGRV